MARLKLDFPDETYTFSTHLEVRFDDINAGMHLAHDRVVSFVAEARSRFLEHLGLSELGGPDEPGVIVSDLAVVYQAEGRLRDRLRLDCGIADATRYGGDIVCRLVRESDDTVIAVAKANIVFFDYHRHKRVQLAPQRFMQAATSLA